MITFPTQAMHAHEGSESARGISHTLYRITSVYGLLSLLVPLLGFGVMLSDMRTWSTNIKLYAAIIATAAAWAVLYMLIIPRQKAMAGELGLLEEDDTAPTRVADWQRARSRLVLYAAIFSGLWVLVFAIMMLL